MTTTGATTDPAPATSYFKHVCYRVGDIDRSLAFYGELGFREQRRYQISDTETKVMLALPDDGEYLGLTFLDGVDSYDLGTGYNHIALTIANMDATLRALEPHDLVIDQAPFSKREGGSLIAFIRDPDGYRIELIQKR
jgi:lactoylglutathione lyase